MNFGLEKNMLDKIERARLLATFIHFNQKRRDGENYINHPKRMVESIFKKWFGEDIWELEEGKDYSFTEEQENIICAIWLHDCIEDAKNSYAVAAMIGCHFSERTMELVRILTHRKWQSYNEYIERVAQNPQALQIKWEDLRDNSSYFIPKKQELKYKNACIFLQGKGIEIPNFLRERFEI